MEEHCLICLQDVKSVGPLGTSPTSHGRPCFENHACDSLNDSCTRKALEHQLPVILLMCKVLKLRRTFVESLLESTGNNPSLWNVRLCSMCLRIFEEASFVWERLQKLHCDFDEITRILRSKFTDSVNQDVSIVTLEGVKASIIINDEATRPRRVGRPKKKVSVSLGDSTVCKTEKLSLVQKVRLEFARRPKTDRLEESVFYPNLKANTANIIRTPASRNTHLKTKTEESTTSKTPVDKRFEANPLSSENYVAQDKENIVKTLNTNQIEEEELRTLTQDIDVSMIDPLEAEDCGGFDSDRNSGSDQEEWDPKQSQSEGSEVDEEDTDFDFDPKTRYHSTVRNRRKGPSKGERGTIIRPQRVDFDNTYECPKCHAIFDDSSKCDEHIIQDHYDGKIRKEYACHICKNGFEGEGWLRRHTRLKHPGTKMPSDKALERSIQEGTLSQLTYDVLPFSEDKQTEAPTQIKVEVQEDSVDESLPTTVASEDSILVNRTVDDPPPNAFCVPIVKTTGKMQYLVLPNAFETHFSEEILSLFKRGENDKECSICPLRFPTEIQLRAHIKRLHEGERLPYECPICSRKFERIGKLAIGHMQRAHMQGRYLCSTCGKSFKDTTLLEAHVQRTHLGIERPYQCIKCNLRHASRAGLNKHLKRSHNLQVAHVPKKSTSAVTFKFPKRTGPIKKRIRKVKRIPCKICAEKNVEIKFATEEELDVHIKRKHMGISRPYPCPICKRKFSRPWIVEEHMQIHTVRNDVAIDDQPPDVFVCVPCNKQFSKKACLDAHLEGTRHKNHRPFVCEICSQTFRGILYLRNHQIQKHYNDHSTNPFKCKFCDKILSSERHLDSHIRICHTKDAKYSCPHCPQQFEHERTMLRHINVRHTKSEKFVCSQCPKSFLNEQYLGYHVLRVHSGEKPYECKFCQKRFSDKPTYNRHVEWHSDVVHDCPHCSKSGFKTRHSLRVHVRTCHKELLDESPINQKHRNSVPIAESHSLPANDEQQLSSKSTVVPPPLVADPVLLNNWSNIFSSS